jgi:hypothetical protein
LVRGDQSGLSLTEYRLHAGFLHCPVPFMGVRQIRAVNALSRSAPMARWDVPGDYTRPICRRIVEEAGVPRELFGIRKKAASVLFFQGASFISQEALAEFLPWLETHEIPIPTGPNPVWTGVARAAEAVGSWVESSGGIGVVAAKAARRVAGWAEREPLFRWLFPWAADRVRGTYQPV